MSCCVMQGAASAQLGGSSSGGMHPSGLGAGIGSLQAEAAGTGGAAARSKAPRGSVAVLGLAAAMQPGVLAPRARATSSAAVLQQPAAPQGATDAVPPPL
jgi:hypothetical protein